MKEIIDKMQNGRVSMINDVSGHEERYVEAIKQIIKNKQKYKESKYFYDNFLDIVAFIYTISDLSNDNSFKSIDKELTAQIREYLHELSRSN
jgi:hypothetical protein